MNILEIYKYIVMNLIIFLLIYIILYGLSEVLYKHYWKQELIRKIAHISTGIITFYSLRYLKNTDYIYLCLIFFIIFIINRRFCLLSFLKQKWRWNGDVYYIFWLAIALSFINSNILITQIGILTLALADGICPIWNKVIPKKLYLYKTIGSFVIFYIISATILFSFYWLNYRIFIIALVVSLWELLSTKWLDNITIPILVALSIILVW